MNEIYIKAILDNSPECIVLIGKNHEVLAFNKTISQVLKFYHGRKIQIGDLYYPDFVIDANKKLYVDTFEKALQGESVMVQDLTESENITVWFEYRMSPVYDEKGQLLGVTLSAKDITNEKKADLKVVKLSERLKAVLDNTNESITLLDLNYRVLTMNKVALQTTKANTNLEPVIGSDFRQFIPHKENIFYDYYPKACNGEEFTVEISYENFDGGLLWYQTKFNPVFNETGKQIGVSIFASDITAKKNYEISLKESEDRFKKISGLSPVGIIITDSKFDITYENYASQRIFGYSSDELLSLSISDLICNFELNENYELKVDGFEFDADQPTFYQGKFEAKSGTNRKTNLFLSSSTFYSKDKLNYIFIIQDVTSIVEKDDLISQQSNKLRDIAWHQSHIIRAPLANILALISLLEENILNMGQVEKQALFQDLTQSARNLDNVICDIIKTTEED